MLSRKSSCTTRPAGRCIDYTTAEITIRLHLRLQDLHGSISDLLCVNRPGSCWWCWWMLYSILWNIRLNLLVVLSYHADIPQVILLLYPVISACQQASWEITWGNVNLRVAGAETWIYLRLHHNGGPTEMNSQQHCHSNSHVASVANKTHILIPSFLSPWNMIACDQLILSSCKPDFLISLRVTVAHRSPSQAIRTCVFGGNFLPLANKSSQTRQWFDHSHSQRPSIRSGGTLELAYLW